MKTILAALALLLLPVFAGMGQTTYRGNFRSLGNGVNTGTFTSNGIPLIDLTHNCYDVRYFGATCSATNVLLLVTNATASTTLTFGVGTPLSAADVGKTIIIWQEGAFTPNATNRSQAYNFTTTISAVAAGGQSITLAQSSTNGWTNTMAVYGWDDTTAIQNALFMITNLPSPTLGLTLIQPGPSIIAGPIVDPSPTNGPHHNSQLYIPQPGFTNAVLSSANGTPDAGGVPWRIPVLTIIGPERPVDRQLYNNETNQGYNLNFVGGAWISGCTNPLGGSLLSAQLLTNTETAYGNEDPRWNNANNVFYANAVCVSFRNMTFTVGSEWNGVALDLSCAANMYGYDSLIDCGFAQYQSPAPDTTPTNSIGLFTPSPSSGGHSECSGVRIVGFGLGLARGEHLLFSGSIFDCQYGVWPIGGHDDMFTCDMENCPTYITANWRSLVGYQVALGFYRINTENVGTATSWGSTYPVTLIQDTNSALHGIVLYENPSDTILGCQGAGNVLRVPYGPQQGPLFENSNGTFQASCAQFVFNTPGQDLDLIYLEANGTVRWTIGEYGGPQGTTSFQAPVHSLWFAPNGITAGPYPIAYASVGGNLVASNSLIDAYGPCISTNGFIMPVGTANPNAAQYMGSSNFVANWPTTPSWQGEWALVTSNNSVYILTCSNTALLWGATNKIAGP